MSLLKPSVSHRTELKGIISFGYNIGLLGFRKEIASEVN